MSITRLTGGLTPGDGADPRTFPTIWNATADDIESQGSAIAAIEAWDIDDLNDVSIGTAVAGQKLVFDGTNWVNLEGYVFVETVYFTSNGTFSKADYPWLRAIRVKCQGAGGGGGGAQRSAGDVPSEAGGGGGGGYAEKFITDISGLSASESITVGASGSGAAAGDNNGTSGGNSSGFGLTGNGGALGRSGGAVGGSDPLADVDQGRGGTGGTASGGDINVTGSGGGVGRVVDAGGGVYITFNSNFGGGAFLSPASQVGTRNAGGVPGSGPGGGGGGASAYTGNRAGGDGGDGIVIVELFA